MAYPSVPILIAGYDERRRDGRTMDSGADGIVRVRKLHTDRFDFAVPHIVDATARATLLTHYAANLVTTFTFTSPITGDSHTVQYVGAPAVTALAPGVFQVVNRLGQAA